MGGGAGGAAGATVRVGGCSVGIVDTAPVGAGVGGGVEEGHVGDPVAW